MLFGKNKQKDKPDNPLEGVPQVHHHHQHVKNVVAISIVGLQSNLEMSSKSDPVNNKNDQQDFCVSMDDVPLSDEEKNRYYKYPKNVMASRRIKELIQANRLMTQQGGQRSNVKMTILFGLALSLQIVAVLLIFI